MSEPILPPAGFDRGRFDLSPTLPPAGFDRGGPDFAPILPPDDFSPFGETTKKLGLGDAPGQIWKHLAGTVTGLPGLATQLVTTPDEFVADARKSIWEISKVFSLMPRMWYEGIIGNEEEADRLHDLFRQRVLEDPLTYLLVGAGTAKGIGSRMAAMQALRRGDMRAVNPSIPETDLREPSAPIYTPRSVSRAAILGWDPKLPEGTKRDVISVQLGKDIPGVGVIGTPLVTRTLPRSSYRADQAIVMDRLLKLLPPHFPLFGENSRAARALRGKTRIPYLALMTEPAFAEADKAWKDMSRKERAAYHLHIEMPDPADYAQHIENMKRLGTPAAMLTVQTMEDPAVRALVIEPSERMRIYNEVGGVPLDELRQQILIKAGAVTPIAAPTHAPVSLLKQFRVYDIAPYSHKELENEIREGGMNDPIELGVDPQGRAAILDGNHRLAIAERLGMEEVPFVVKQVDELEKTKVPIKSRDLSALGLDGTVGTVPEFEASPFRVTQLLRGGRYLTNSLANKYLRKTDASIAAAERKKPKLVSEANRFGTNDLRTITTATRKATEELIAESGLRARIFGRSQRGEDRARTLGGQPEGYGALRDLDDISLAADLAKERVDRTLELLDPAMGGEIDTNLLADLGLKMPEGGWPTGELAYRQAVHAAAVAVEVTEEKRILAALKRAQNGTSTARELTELGITIPSDLHVPTEAELVRATKLRAQAGSIKERLREAKKWKLKPEEKASMKANIQRLTEEALRLESTRPIRRSEATLNKRQNSRYGRAQKILRKDLAKQRQRIERMGEAPTGPADRRGEVHGQVLSALQRKAERDITQHDRLFGAEHALRESLLRTAETVAKLKGIAGEKSAFHQRKADYIAGTRMRMRDLIEHQQDLIALRNEIDSRRGQIIGGGSPADLRAEFAAGRTPAGKPWLTPHYRPHEMAVERPSRLSRAEGSIAPPRPGADIYPSRSVLFRTGQLAFHPDTLGPAYFAAAKHALNVDMHRLALAASTKILHGQSPPPGWEFLRATRGEKISEIEKMGGEHLRSGSREFARSEDMTTTDAKDPHLQETMIDGRRYRHIVPKNFANEFRQERVNSNKFQKYFLEKPMDVWRTLLLHLRVPWLVNNILGNSFLYAIRFAGMGGLASVARFYAEDKKTMGAIPAMKRLAQHTLNPDQFAQVFPGQARGTFLENMATGDLPEWARDLVPQKARTFTDESRTARRAVKTAQGVTTFLPRVDKRYERYLRRKATVRVLRGSDEVRDAYATIRKQGGSPTFHEAVQKAIDGDENFVDFVMKEVNAGLGDFLSLSRVERGYIRQLVPFYAWMREIARITGRLVVDHPLRVAVLSQMSKAAAEIQAEEVPEYMRGSILTEKAGWLGKLAELIPGLGGEHGVSALAVHSMSPYTTVTDTVRGFQAINPFGGGNPSERREFIGNLNPLIGAFLGAYGRPESRATHGLFFDTAEEFARSVPQVQAASPYASDLYPDRDRWDLIRKILTGDPRVRFDPDEAAYQKEIGR